MSGVRVETVRPERERPPRTPAARPGAAARVLGAAALASALVAVAVFHIWSRTRVLDAGYELGEQTKAHARLSSEHDRLRIEVETLRAPSRLEQYARTRLGMAPPAPGAVWVAGPRLASATAGGAGGMGVDRRPVPAGPVLLAGGRNAPRAGFPAGGRNAPQTPDRSGRGSSASPSALGQAGRGASASLSARAQGGEARAVSNQVRAAAAAGPSAVPGERVALRGPPRAGRAPPVREHD